MFVSPDAGGVERARAFTKRLNAALAIIDKRRERANVTEVMNLIGDVKGSDCIIVDDMIDTAGTLAEAARALVDKGAKRVVACATHGVLSGPAIQRIDESPLSEVIVTDTIPLSAEAKACPRSPGEHRAAARRGNQAHPQLGLGQLAVRLKLSPERATLPSTRRAYGLLSVRPPASNRRGITDGTGRTAVDERHPSLS